MHNFTLKHALADVDFDLALVAKKITRISSFLTELDIFKWWKLVKKWVLRSAFFISCCSKSLYSKIYTTKCSKSYLYLLAVILSQIITLHLGPPSIFAIWGHFFDKDSSLRKNEFPLYPIYWSLWVRFSAQNYKKHPPLFYSDW